MNERGEEEIKIMKNLIDDMSFEKMLRLWRFEPIGSKWFRGEIGEYFTKVFAEKKQKLSSVEHVQASKSVGWEE